MKAYATLKKNKKLNIDGIAILYVTIKSSSGAACNVASENVTLDAAGAGGKNNHSQLDLSLSSYVHKLRRCRCHRVSDSSKEKAKQETYPSPVPETLDS